MWAYLIDSNTLTVYTGSAWSTVGPTHGAWTSYTPSWTSSGSAPAIGNGSVTGAYQRIGRNVIVRIALVWGSTTTNGTGTYFLSVPVTSNSTQPSVGVAIFTDASAATFYHHVAYLPASSSTMQFIRGDGTTTQFQASTPVVQATSDALYVTLVYEAAADA